VRCGNRLETRAWPGFAERFGRFREIRRFLTLPGTAQSPPTGLKAGRKNTGREKSLVTSMPL
jgi:hypothetical protein